LEAGSLFETREERQMKGFIRKAVAALGCVVTLAGAGCYHYRDIVDPCYPERYWWSSRTIVNGMFGAQVRNGHILDQTVWNYHFEAGSDKLTPGGMEHLNYLVRRRPCADPMVFLQTAHDLTYDPAKPAEYPVKRRELDEKRIVAVKNYLSAYASGGNAPPFQVLVHNPPDPGQAGPPVAGAVTQIYSTSKGILPGGAGTVTGGGGSGR
jgi:hypothetical protein